MKKRKVEFIPVLGLLLVFGFIVFCITGVLMKKHYRTNYYPQTMYVYQVDTIHDVVTFVDHNHELWQIEGVEDWDVGECASLIMFDNYTPEIKDDVIVRARYCGFNTCGEVPFVY